MKTPSSIQTLIAAAYAAGIETAQIFQHYPRHKVGEPLWQSVHLTKAERKNRTYEEQQILRQEKYARQLAHDSERANIERQRDEASHARRIIVSGV